MFQHTAARRRLEPIRVQCFLLAIVSTHSRPKAAGSLRIAVQMPVAGFNTQPPEGGWVCEMQQGAKCRSFNTQPPEGGWFE